MEGVVVKQVQVLSREKRTLKVPLTDSERLDLGDLMARSIQQAETAEAHKDAASKQYKAQIETAQGEAARCAKLLAAGVEYRDVECEVQPLPPEDGKEPQVQIVRMDTHEVVQVREMTQGERQRALPLPEPETVLDPDESDATMAPDVSGEVEGSAEAESQ